MIWNLFIGRWTHYNSIKKCWIYLVCRFGTDVVNSTTYYSVGASLTRVGAIVWNHITWTPAVTGHCSVGTSLNYVEITISAPFIVIILLPGLSFSSEDTSVRTRWKDISQTVFTHFNYITWNYSRIQKGYCLLNTWWRINTTQRVEPFD